MPMLTFPDECADLNPQIKPREEITGRIEYF